MDNIEVAVNKNKLVLPESVKSRLDELLENDFKKDVIVGIRTAMGVHCFTNKYFYETKVNLGIRMRSPTLAGSVPERSAKVEFGYEQESGIVTLEGFGMVDSVFIVPYEGNDYFMIIPRD